MNAAIYKKLSKALEGEAELEISALKEYLEKRKKISHTIVAPRKNDNAKPLVASSVWKLSKENLAALEKFVELLKLKAYSASTISTYRNEFLQFLQLLKIKPVNELTPDNLRRYIWCM